MDHLLSDADTVRNEMNKSSSAGAPFLFAVDFEMERGIFIREPLSSRDILFRMGDITNSVKKRSKTDKRACLSIKSPLSLDEYRRRFSIVSGGLMRGDTYLINLTCKTAIELNISMEEIFYASQSPFAICVRNGFVCFSPERFVRVENGVISSRPMKGTILSNISGAEEKILSDYKESCEHNTITDLIRNDLGKVSRRVWVERFRYIDRVMTDRGEILQVSSDIRGEISAQSIKRAGDLIFSMLPAGSVSGAPKLSTLRIIGEAEGEKRGFYTGVFGYFDGNVLDSAVIIRYIERDADGALWYRSGGGITVNSNCDDEYKEMMDKIYLPF
ncbi:MAG: aminodeoxychorismate synthase component I [Bacteroidales bacterium]|nr:aminodeoxychorismate synthase component I [Bacteroidales bacterium]